LSRDPFIRRTSGWIVRIIDGPCDCSMDPGSRGFAACPG
jgi:hypothetical protein